MSRIVIVASTYFIHSYKYSFVATAFVCLLILFSRHNAGTITFCVCMYCMFRLIAAIIKYVNLYNHPFALASVYSGNTLYRSVAYVHILLTAPIQ